MTRILIPRSDSVSAKIIEPSDFENLWSSDILRDYKHSGFTMTAGSGLTVNMAVGKARVKGLFIESTAIENVASLTASTTNYIYITLARDGNSEAESWSFTKNTSGTTPTDSFFIGKAVTGGSTVSSVSQADVISKPELVRRNPDVYFGDGSDGAVTISTSTALSETKQYTDLTINAGQTLSPTANQNATLVIFCTGTFTLNGTINMVGKGALGGQGGLGNKRPGWSSYANQLHKSGSRGDTGQKGSVGYGGDVNAGGGAGGLGGEGGESAGGTEGDQISINGVKNIPYMSKGVAYQVATTSLPVYGSGGSGGSGGGSGGGGNWSLTTPGHGANGGNGSIGGAGGGGVIICAKTIVLASGSTINTSGSNGTNGVDGDDASNPTTGGAGGGGGGGGAGGGGEAGSIILLYETLTNSGTITKAGGTGGTGGAVGAGHSPNPNVGGNGVTGSNGILTQIPVL